MKIKHIGAITLGLRMVALLGVGMVLAAQYSRPLGPSMALAAADESAVQPVSSAKLNATPTSQTASAAQSAQSPKKFCGNNGKMTIMVVGSDADPDYYPPGADLVRYVQVDFDQQKVTIFTFPRGLWLETKHLADLNVDTARLGKVYHYQYQAELAKTPKQDEQKLVVKASQAVAQTILDNFEVKPDHYMVVKLSNLSKLVDSIDGVTINNPAPLHFTWAGVKMDFPGGEQTLNGYQTNYYVRYEPAATHDFDRIDRQNLVLKALYSKLEQPATLPKIPGFFTQLADSFVTDLSVENITDLTCVLSSVADDHFVLEGVHSDMVTPGPELSQVPDMDKVNALLKSLELVK